MRNLLLGLVSFKYYGLTSICTPSCPLFPSVAQLDTYGFLSAERPYTLSMPKSSEYEPGWVKRLNFQVINLPPTLRLNISID